MAKKYDVVARIGEYEDEDGETRGRWLTVGAVIETDNGPCLLLERSFNPAGMPRGRKGTTAVLLNLFKPDSGKKGKKSEKKGEDFDDDMPF